MRITKERQVTENGEIQSSDIIIKPFSYQFITLFAATLFMLHLCLMPSAKKRAADQIPVSTGFSSGNKGL